MSKNKVPQVDGRVHDGFHYLVLLYGMHKEVRLGDSRAIDSLWAAIKEAKKVARDSKGEVNEFSFSGARSMVEAEQIDAKTETRPEVGPLDGVGIYPADAIVGLRYAGALADVYREEAYEAAAAALEAQQEAAEAAAEEAITALGERQQAPGENGTAAPLPLPSALASAADDEDDEEGEDD